MATAEAAIGPAPPDRPRVLLFGTALTLVPVLMAFATVMGIYLSQRSKVLAIDGAEWIAGGTIPLTQPNFMAMTWVFSAFTMQWAVYSLARSDRSSGLLALILTMVLGFGYINQSSYLDSIMELDRSTTAGLLVSVIVYGHMLMALVGLIFLLLVTFRVVAGQYLDRPEGVAAAALYWYVTGGVYSIIWFAIYVTK